MTDVKLDVVIPEELVELLRRSRLFEGDAGRQVRTALAVHLFLLEEVSVGKAAELAGQPLVQFHDTLRLLGLPMTRYDETDLADDIETTNRLKQAS